MRYFFPSSSLAEFSPMFHQGPPWAVTQNVACARMRQRVGFEIQAVLCSPSRSPGTGLYLEQEGPFSTFHKSTVRAISSSGQKHLF